MNNKRNKTGMDGLLRKYKAAASPLRAFLNDLYRKYKPLRQGPGVEFMPKTGQCDPDLFGISVVTKDGQVFEAGDSNVLFAIQSISKPFVYGMALEDHGRDHVLSKVSVEPSGEAYNAIVLDEDSKRPFNPMVNAGAIATTALIKGENETARLQRLLDMYRRYVGREVTIDMKMYTHERSVGHRNHAIAYLMLSFGMIETDIEETLDLYLKQCSMQLTCRDLAVMGATLANHGVNPLTGKRAVEASQVKYILSVMYTCGMYDYAGEWAFRVGLPAKSGVCGGIVAVVPNQMGIAVFSPPLDIHGNSVRGIKVCEEFSEHFGLHSFASSVGDSSFLASIAGPPQDTH